MWLRLMFSDFSQMLSAIATRQSGPPIHNCREFSPAFWTSTPHRTVSRPVEKISHFPLVSFSINIPVPVKKKSHCETGKCAAQIQIWLWCIKRRIPVNRYRLIQIHQNPTIPIFEKSSKLLSINFEPVNFNRSSNQKSIQILPLVQYTVNFEFAKNAVKKTETTVPVLLLVLYSRSLVPASRCPQRWRRSNLSAYFALSLCM